MSEGNKGAGPRATRDGLSDRALAVFAFAIYHQLESGESVAAVVGRDGAGHRADRQALRELESHGLAHHEDDRIHLTPRAQEIVASLIEAMRERMRGEALDVFESHGIG